VVSGRRSRAGGASIRCVPRSVLIVDDHAMFRGLARRMLEADGWCVVAEAQDAATARVAVRQHRPDLVLLDVMLPDADGCALAGELDAVVVLISSHDAVDLGSRLERSAARGFVHKDALSGAVLAAVLG
jgi:DNA-binding NarL/FixJ family response regulator